MSLTGAALAQMIDHSLLKPGLGEVEVRGGIELARSAQLAAVSVKPYLVPLAVEMLQGSPVRVDAVVSFPHGDELTATKVFAARQAIAAGAREIDMVINIGALISGRERYVQEDMAAVVEAAEGALVKVILEVGYLTPDQIVLGCRLAEAARVDFVKTCSGFGPRDYTLDDLRLMRRSVSARVQVKAAQGVHRLADVLAARQAGATRVGTSHSASILAEWERSGSGPAGGRREGRERCF